MLRRPFLVLLLALAAPAFAQAPAPAPAKIKPAKIKITSAADLPVHTYAVGSRASILLDDPARVSALAAAVSANITEDLAKYDLSDPAAARDLYETLLLTAFLQKNYSAAREDLQMVRRLEDKPADRVTRGLLDEALLDSLESPSADFHAALRANMKRLYSAVPFALVRDKMQQQKGSIELLTRSLVVGQFTDARSATAPARAGEQITKSLLEAAFALQYILPNKADIAAAYSAVLSAHTGAVSPDIWTAQEATLTAAQTLTPVTVAIWDSGVDVSLFPAQRVSGEGGIAFDQNAQPTTGLLYPLPGGAAAGAARERDMKGLMDQQAGVDSPEATALRAKLAALPQNQVQSFFEGLSQFTSYAHGTHVAGIALRGNPAARLLVCRITSEGGSVHQPPSVARATRTAAMYRQSAAYFQKRGVRVVNISWIVPLANIESSLSGAGVGGTPAEQRALAVKIYGIMSQGFADALRSAPDILFVAAAGNEDQNVLFDSTYPAGLKAANLLIVGAVDQSGEETSFTSFGNVDVYADGVDVPSFVPGGATLKLSGTSMAAPQVTNLAAKVLAEYPALSVAQLKAALLAGADPHAVGGRTIRLLNPKQTLARLNTHP